MPTGDDQMWVPPVADTGWRCPACRAVNAPSVSQCPCSPVLAGDWTSIRWPQPADVPPLMPWGPVTIHSKVVTTDASGWTNIVDEAGNVTGYRLG